jgi:hypothetical protein
MRAQDYIQVGLKATYFDISDMDAGCKTTDLEIETVLDKPEHFTEELVVKYHLDRMPAYKKFKIPPAKLAGFFKRDFIEMGERVIFCKVLIDGVDSEHIMMQTENQFFSSIELVPEKQVRFIVPVSH